MMMMQIPQHPNVVQLFGVCTQPLALVVEFCHNGILLHLLKDEATTIFKSQIIQFMRDITAGLIHLHDNGIIHRDLAARNILLDSDWVCKVGDFGLSRERQNDGARTQTDSGPLKWMSPEAIHDHVYNVYTDTWSLAVTFSEILTRQTPYPELAPLQVALAVVQGGARPAIPDWTPMELQDAYGRMLSLSMFFFVCVLSDMTHLSIYLSIRHAISLTGLTSHTDPYDRPDLRWVYDVIEQVGQVWY